MKLNHIIIISLVIIIAFLLTCNKNPVEVKRFTKTITRVDSVKVTDTLFKTIYEPIKEIIYITTIDTNKAFKTHHYGLKDSLLSINAYVNSEIKPKNVLIDYKFDQITLKDSVFIKDSVHVIEKIPPKSYASIGIMLTGNQNNFGFSPMLEYNHKKGASFKAGYDPINNIYMVGFSKKLSFRKP